MLKRQTIWLMTMLSLVAVLSVYYLTTPKEKMATSVLNQGTEKSAKDKATTQDEDADPVFAQLRMQLNDDRSKEKEELQEVVGQANVSEQERAEAVQKMQELTDTQTKENLLENLIVALGYDDALVRVENSGVRVTVKAGKNSSQAANKIIKLVAKEVGSAKPVSVEFQKI